ncbi:hypothetical protein TELCIR_26328, partial [Teladorsagia circumcincta]
VIEVRQCPKWFIWPNRNRRNEDEVDENHNKNGYGAIRRNVLRGSKRMQLEKEGVPGRTASEPARRLSAKKDKAVTEPIQSGSPSNTFKILSIAKKWESFDATDDESEEVVCHHRRRHVCACVLCAFSLLMEGTRAVRAPVVA